jgi:hypothetical protein
MISGDVDGAEHQTPVVATTTIAGKVCIGFQTFAVYFSDVNACLLMAVVLDVVLV